MLILKPAFVSSFDIPEMDFVGCSSNQNPLDLHQLFFGIHDDEVVSDSYSSLIPIGPLLILGFQEHTFETFALHT